MILKMENKYEDYLRDESKLQGYADSISFPENEREIEQIILNCGKDGITIQGGRTGLVGGAVPMGGHLMNLSKMNRILSYEEGENEAYIMVEAGVTLMDLEQEIERHSNGKSLYWPCMPTEKSATVGGCVATNARGIYGFIYGGTKNYVESVRLITSKGKLMEFSRKSDEELLNQIIGSEGILGVITAVKLRLVKKSACVWGLVLFFEDEERGTLFADDLLTCKGTGAMIAAAEWIDRRGIDLLEEKKTFMNGVREFPDILPEYNCAVLLEIHGENEEGVLEIAGQMMELGIQYGSDPDYTWAMSGEMDVRKLRDYRHKVAEAVNMKVEENHQKCGSIVKLSTDITAKGAFSKIHKQYSRMLRMSGIDGTIFGHILSKDLHMNLFPKNEKEYEQGKQLMLKLGNEVAKETMISEHGAGKLKTELYSSEELRRHIEIKMAFDPENVWNRGDVGNFELCSVCQTGASSI